MKTIYQARHKREETRSKELHEQSQEIINNIRYNALEQSVVQPTGFEGGKCIVHQGNNHHVFKMLFKTCTIDWFAWKRSYLKKCFVYFRFWMKSYCPLNGLLNMHRACKVFHSGIIVLFYQNERKTFSTYYQLETIWFYFETVSLLTTQKHTKRLFRWFILNILWLPACLSDWKLYLDAELILLILNQTEEK